MGRAASVGARGAGRLAVALTLAAIVIAGAVARFWGIDFGLPHTQARPDETQVMDVALHYLRGNPWPKFYDYPRLYNYALVLAYLAYYAVRGLTGNFGSLASFVGTWPFDWAPFFLINRSLSACAGILAIPVVYAMGRRVRGTPTGLVAAFFMAFAYGHVRDSHFGTTDTSLVLLSAASVLWLLNCEPDRWGRRDVVAAGLAGLAAATKYNGVILLVPVAISQALHAWRQRSLAAFADGRAFAMAATFAVAFAIGVPFVFFNFDPFLRAMREMLGSFQLGGAPQEAGAWWYHFGVSLRYGLGIPVLACALAGLVLTAWRDWRTGLLLFSFPVAYFAVAGSMGLHFARYAWPILPFACVGAAVTVTATASRLPMRGPSRAAATIALSLVAIAPSVEQVVGFDRVIAATDSRVIVANWLAQHAEARASVMVSGSLYGYPQLGPRFQTWFWDRRERAFTFSGRRAEGRPDWILVQESPLPNWTQPAVLDLLNTGYQQLTSIKAFDPREKDNVYDLQDAFFVPLAGFKGVRRPGPNFTIYKHPQARYLEAALSGGVR